MQSVKEKINPKNLTKKLGVDNPMAVPRIEKVVISTGIGSVNDKDKIELIIDRLARITGQKASPRPAKRSIASFSIRQGDIVGYQVTLRGAQMYAFLDKLIHIAFPRTKDFRGITPTAIDDMGNITIGIKEHTVFPEASDEELKNVFGLAVTIVTTASDKKEAYTFLEEVGIPFKKEE